MGREPSREARLDPVRWRRPGRSMVFRSAVIAALVVTAAVVIRAGPGGCEPSCPAPGASPGSATKRASDAPGGSAGHPSTAGTDTGGGPVGGGGPAGVSPAGAGVSPAGAGGPARVAVPPGMVGVPIRLAEPTALTLVRPGDRVDVFRVPDPGESPRTVATAALILGVTGADDPLAGGLLLALTPAQARHTVTPPSGGYSVLIRPDG